MTSIEAYQKRIEAAVNDLEFRNDPVELFEPVSYILSLGGKRIRPVLTLLACEMFSGEHEAAIDQAVALEIFHNFTLLHDDIMDSAPLRRNNPTVHSKWNDNTAILSGDAMLVLAYQYACRCSGEKLPRVLEVFNETALGVCRGQQYDMNFETRDDVQLEEYVTMISLKTAVLLGACLQIGAIIGGAGNEDAQRLYDFGMNLGIAFQLQDDLLDVYGDPGKFGKQVGGDILANKKTWLLLKAFQLSNEEQRAELNRWLAESNGNATAKVQAVTEFYNQLQLRELAQEEINHYHKISMDQLELVNGNEAMKEQLKGLAEMLLVREA